MLRRAKDLLRHQIPKAGFDDVINKALVLLLKEIEKKKFAATERPAPRRESAAGSRHVPADVQRAVWERDGEQCAFVGENGHRCTERAFLERDHDVPYGMGGKATVQNIRHLCRRHNQWLAKQWYGSWWQNGVREAPAEYKFGSDSLDSTEIELGAVLTGC